MTDCETHGASPSGVPFVWNTYSTYKTTQLWMENGTKILAEADPGTTSDAIFWFFENHI